jgi:hypothetical protein
MTTQITETDIDNLRVEGSGLPEAIDKITQLADQARDVKVHRLPGESDRVVRVPDADGQLQPLRLERPERLIECDHLDELIRLASDPFDQALRTADRRVVFYGRTEVVLIFDYADAAEMARLPLVRSDEYIWIQDRLDDPKITPRTFQQDLRTTLRHTMDTDDRKNLAGLVGELSTATSQGVSQVATRERDTMAVSSGEQAGSALPDEEQVFTCRMFANGDLTARNPIT